jgi:hypothetical protein
MLLRTKPGYWKQTVRGILGLLEQYGAEAVNLSLKRATYYQAVDVTTIKHILEKKLYAFPICNGLQSKPAGTAISAFSGPH